MSWSARVYLQSDNKYVQVFQLKKSPDSPEYVLDSPAWKTAPVTDAQAIGKLVQSALEGTLHQ